MHVPACQAHVSFSARVPAQRKVKQGRHWRLPAVTAHAVIYFLVVSTEQFAFPSDNPDCKRLFVLYILSKENPELTGTDVAHP